MYLNFVRILYILSCLLLFTNHIQCNHNREKWKSAIHRTPQERVYFPHEMKQLSERRFFHELDPSEHFNFDPFPPRMTFNRGYNPSSSPHHHHHPFYVRRIVRIHNEMPLSFDDEKFPNDYGMNKYIHDVPIQMETVRTSNKQRPAPSSSSPYYHYPHARGVPLRRPVIVRVTKPYSNYRHHHHMKRKKNNKSIILPLRRPSSSKPYDVVPIVKVIKVPAGRTKNKNNEMIYSFDGSRENDGEFDEREQTIKSNEDDSSDVAANNAIETILRYADQISQHD